MDNFIVSARKYRPSTFASVVGQTHITSTLKNAISRNQLAHAYLFCGPRGVGKTTCARIFAKAINCTDPSGSEACGECESCRSFNEGRSFNIHELDAASNNSVDDIRTLTEQVRIPPQVGRYSVYIIDEVHMLSASAFNAFLKTLEEPPAHAVFILATTEKHKIIPTILSRCQIYDFNRIRVEDSVGYLKQIASAEGVTADDESLNLIAQKADGGMRDALSMFDKAVAFCGSELHFKEVARTLNVLDYDTYFTVTDLVGAGDYKGALLLFDEVLRKGFSGLTFISGLNTHFRDLLMCKAPGTLSLLEVTGSLLERYKQQSVRYETGFLFDAISILSALDGTFKTATNQRLHVELGLMKLCALAQKKTEIASQNQSLPPLLKENAASPAASQSPQGAVKVTAEDRTGKTPPDSTRSKDFGATHGSTPSGEVGPSERPVETVANASSVVSPGSPETAKEHHPATPRAAAPAGSTAARSSAGSDRTGGKTVSGISINEILKNGGVKQQAAENASPAADGGIDPEAEAKIVAAREEFLEILGRKRPRVSTALEGILVTGNKITASVASEVLREDILLHQKEILDLLRKVGGIEGTIELEIELREDPQAVRPIRPEDKLEHLRSKNSLLDDLRRELSLEME